MTRSRNEIITEFVFPPIPIRSFDWCAYRKDSDEFSILGEGKTELEAITNLIEQDKENG